MPINENFVVSDVSPHVRVDRPIKVVVSNEISAESIIQKIYTM